jgi:hypothetical protein
LTQPFAPATATAFPDCEMLVSALPGGADAAAAAGTDISGYSFCVNHFTGYIECVNKDGTADNEVACICPGGAAGTDGSSTVFVAGDVDFCHATQRCTQGAAGTTGDGADGVCTGTSDDHPDGWNGIPDGAANPGDTVTLRCH